MSADKLQWLALLLGVFLLAGMWIGWECWGRPLRRAEKSFEALRRYRQAVDDVDRWCGHQFPQARLIAEHIQAIGEGKGLNSGTPAGMEPCTVPGLRQQLTRLASHEPPNYLINRRRLSAEKQTVPAASGLMTS